VESVGAHAVAHQLRHDLGARAARANSKFLRATSIPAPSPHHVSSFAITVRPTDWDARSGSSLRVESARIAANPPTPIGVIHASVPPQIMASASPR